MRSSTWRWRLAGWWWWRGASYESSFTPPSRRRGSGWRRSGWRAPWCGYEEARPSSADGGTRALWRAGGWSSPEDGANSSAQVGPAASAGLLGSLFATAPALFARDVPQHLLAVRAAPGDRR